MEALYLRSPENRSIRRHGVPRVSLATQTGSSGERATLQVTAMRSDNPGVCGHGRRG